MKTEVALFGAGCFWGVEEAFSKVRGVVSTTVGYSGGVSKDPDYGQVCLGKSGHAETVRVEFDPKTISYRELLRVFWSAHDPTQVNRQGPDIGTQYRSVIFYHNKEQKKAAEESLQKRSRKLGKIIATSIEPSKGFYKAEEYHQKYYQKGVGGKLKAVFNW